MSLKANLNTKAIYINLALEAAKLKTQAENLNITESLKAKYIKALNKEIDYFFKQSNLNSKINSLYLASNISEDSDLKYLKPVLKTIEQYINFSKDVEVSLEIIPKDLSQDFFKEIKELGINRLVYKVNSFSQSNQKYLIDEVSRREIETCLNYANLYGLNNNSIDLIYAFPEQDKEELIDDLESIYKLNFKHIYFTSYLAELEDFSHLKDEAIDKERKFYHLIRNYFISRDYKHLELHILAKDGYASRQNRVYYEGKTYLGFGLNASGYVNKCRYKNPSSLEEYLEKSKLNKPYAGLEYIDTEAEQSEYLILALSTSKGINLKEYQQKFSKNLDASKIKTLNKFTKRGLLDKKQASFRLSAEGLDYSQHILSELLYS